MRLRARLVLARALAPALLSVVSLGLLGCSGDSSHHAIEMVPLPPPSAAPEVPSTPDGTTTTTSVSSGAPTPLPSPGAGSSGGPTDSNADSPSATTISNDDLKAAIDAAGWKLSGNVHTAREGAYDVTTATVSKPGIRGKVQLMQAREGAGTKQPPHLPADANPGTLVEIEAGRGADAYFYDRARQRAGRVELKAPATRTDAGTLLRACFPFAN